MQAILGFLGITPGCIYRQAVHRDPSEVVRHNSNGCLTNCIFLLRSIVFRLFVRSLEIHGHEMLWVHRTHQRQWPCQALQRRSA